jgi:cytochrome P450
MPYPAAMICPHESLDPLSLAYLTDPYERLASRRRDTPVFYDADLDMYVLTRHADIDTVFRDPELFSAANAQDPVFPLCDEAKALLADVGFRKIRTMSNLDGPEHTRIRTHNQVGFSPRRLRAMEPIVLATTRSLIDAFPKDRKPIDFVRALSFPLPASIVFSLLGFPPEDTDMLKGWCGDRMSFSWGRPTSDDQQRIAHDMISYWSYCEAHVQRRLKEPADDFTTDLLAIHLADPSTLSTGEIAHVIYGMSFAGHETTTNLITNTVRRILEADAWPTLCADPTLISHAVDEGLRLDTSVLTWRRMTTAATTIGGVDVPAGAKLLLVLGAANRDPEVFANPEVFDISRTDANRHLSFGFGKHYCLGATLAKLEVQVVLRELTHRFPKMRLVANQPLDFHPNISFRGPRELLVLY